MLLRLLIKVVNGTTKDKNLLNSKKKTTAKGQSPTQELEVGPRCGTFVQVFEQLIRKTNFWVVNHLTGSGFLQPCLGYRQFILSLRKNYNTYWYDDNYTAEDVVKSGLIKRLVNKFYD